jgi:uncharacterized protein (DUF362 family)/Pyruvate/2-oxoacid:ferredoxin oxidoreductase delta subunit
MTTKVALTRCDRYVADDVFRAVKTAVDLVGGIGAFVKRDERVLIKPNMLTDAGPEEGVCTHPEVVRAVIRLIKPVTKNISCGDSPSVFGEKKDAERVYEATGIKKVCVDEGVALVHFAAPRMHGRYPLTDELDRIDRLINVPKFKTHGLTVLTAGVKNLFGLVVGMNKVLIHRDFVHPEDLSRAIMDIYLARRPDLTILDGIVAMEGEGPGSCGTLRSLGLVAASPDALAMDRVLARIMGLSPEAVPTIREALRRGISGEADVVGEPLEGFRQRDFFLPKASVLQRLPRWSTGLVKVILNLRPWIDVRLCRDCGACVRSCPASAIARARGRMTIDSRRCQVCLCCQEVCPYAAIRVRNNIFLNLRNRLKSESPCTKR